MTSQPWMKFFPSDWRSDPRLRMCSLAARGLWMEMLMLMHEAEPYGHLLVAGIAPSEDQLAVLAGTSPAEIPALLAELESADVFSRNTKGVIYSRRMTRDEKKARLAQKNGLKGGNPTLCKTRPNPPPDKGHVNGEDKTQSPESRIQKESKEEKGDSTVGVDSNPARAEGQEEHTHQPPSGNIVPIKAGPVAPLPDGWVLPEPWRAEALAAGHYDPDEAAERFATHWLGKRDRGDRDAVNSEAGWLRLWKGWINGDIKRGQNHGRRYAASGLGTGRDPAIKAGIEAARLACERMEPRRGTSR